MVSPPPLTIVVVPVTGTPWSESFQAISFATASMAGASSGIAVNVPSVATPVEKLLKPCAWAPITAASMPPARPSKIVP